MNNKIVIFIAMSLLISSCGGGGAGDSTTSSVSGSEPSVFAGRLSSPFTGQLTGKFIDSNVEGLAYSTATMSGLTNAAGEYDYRVAESVVFSIGDIQFNSVKAASYISPLDIFNSSNTSDIAVSNMARLLQSLDQDGDSSNGITISALTRQMAVGVTIDFTDPNFENASAVINFVANSGAANGGSASTSLITASVAIAHLDQSLATIPADACKANSPKVGFTGNLRTISHQVSGTVTVVDDCTMIITNFNYDGGGPRVYLYAGNTAPYNPATVNSFRIGPGRIDTQRFSNASIRVKIPSGKTLDDVTGISLWCEVALANFGDTTLAK